MTVTESSPPLDDNEAGSTPMPSESRRPGRRRRRSGAARPHRLLDRITMSTVIGLIAALLAFALTAVLLRDRREMVTVAVAAERIPAGTLITPSMVDAVEVPASVSFVDGLVRIDDLGDSSVAARTVQPGEALARSALGSRTSTTGVRVMAIPVESWQAAGGELDVGDQVDVIDTGDSGPRYVLSGAAVVGRSADDSGGGLGGSSNRGDLWIAVEVSAAEALELASVIDGDDFVMVRSTGAAPGAVAEPATEDDPDPASPPDVSAPSGSTAPASVGGGG